MNNDSRDPIIDSLLEEVFGGEQPPDLTARIMQQHDAMFDADSSKLPSSQQTASDDVVIDVANRQPSTPHVKRKRNNIGGWVTAAVVLIGAGLFATWAVWQNQRLEAINPKPISTQRPPKIAQKQQPVTPVGPLPNDDPLVDQTPIPAWAHPDQTKDELNKSRKPPRVDQEPQPASESLVIAASPQFQRSSAVSGKPWGDARIVRFIDDELQSSWDKMKITPAPRVKEMAWFSRATATLLGRNPSDAEKARYADRPDREEALRTLLNHDEFARHWASRFAEVLVGNTPTERIDRLAFEKYLAESIQTGKPFDELSFELITAQGSGNENDEAFNPASNFLLAHAGRPKPKQELAGVTSVTDRVCQVFLGQQMQCGRCHDDKQTKVAQQRYWEIASFFAQMRVLPNQEGQAILVNRDYAGAKGDSLDEAEVFYTKSDGVGASALPVNLQGEPLPTNSGRAKDIDRRAELAKSIVSSEAFAQATVNRLWKFVFHSGFTLPVDDMGKHKSVSHDQLLARLGTEFQNSKFDLRATLRWMLKSRAFELELAPNNGTPLAFSSFARRDRASLPHISNAVSKLAKATQNGERFNAAVLAQRDQLSEQEIGAELQRGGSRYRYGLLSTAPDSLLLKLGDAATLTNEQRIEHLFLAIVGREPTPQERKHSLTVLNNSRQKINGLRRIGWIIVNSQEFKKQH